MSSIIKKIEKFLTDSQARFTYMNSLGLYKSMSDQKFLEQAFKINMGQELNLNNPQSFNEKIQWLKLYNRQPEYTILVDKYKVRQYIADSLGEEYLIPLLGVWDDPDKIDFALLPNRFVLKCNHNSGLGMCICKDKSKLDIAKVKKNLRRGMQQDYYQIWREWPYKNVPRKIICEKYLTDESQSELKDYKIHNFNGSPKLILVCSNRFSKSGLCEDFYDVNWNRLDLKRPNCRTTDSILPRPDQLEKMLELSKKIAKGHPFVRTDFYQVNGKIYFGEVTLYPASGLSKYSPVEWDKKLGDWITLPEKI